MPARPSTEEMFTIEPPFPAAIIGLGTARMPRNVPTWLMFTMFM